MYPKQEAGDRGNIGNVQKRAAFFTSRGFPYFHERKNIPSNLQIKQQIFKKCNFAVADKDPDVPGQLRAAAGEHSTG